MLRKVLEKYAVSAGNGGMVKADLYEIGLSGKANSSLLRDKVSQKLGLPPRLPANMFLGALNRITNLEELKKICTEIENEARFADAQGKDRR